MAAGRAASPVRSGEPSENGPRWRQIKTQIEREIECGRFPPGSKLPTEEELAMRFGVHRHTVRRAVGYLREREFVRVEHGRGIFVREPVLGYRIGRNTRLTSAASHQGRSARYQVLSRGTVAANRETSYALGLPGDHPVEQVRMLRLIDGTPIAITDSFYPQPRFRGITKLIAETGSVSASMRRYGISEFPRKRLDIRAVSPTSREAALLEVERSMPLLELCHTNVDSAGVPVEYCVSRHVSTRFRLTVDF